MTNVSNWLWLRRGDSLNISALIPAIPMNRATFLFVTALTLISAGCNRAPRTAAESLLSLHVDPMVYAQNPKLREQTLKECLSGTPDEQVQRMQLEACQYASDTAVVLRPNS